jgi:threonyl-tRNA synthetase
MPLIRTLPDGSQRSFDAPVTVADVAADIGPGLAKAAVAGRVDGRLVDTSTASKTTPTGHRHRPRPGRPGDHPPFHCAPAGPGGQAAVPLAQVTIGPVIEDGFYYDFAFERPFTPEDLAAIEARMAELAEADQPVHREVMDRDEAVAFFRGIGEEYKARIIEEIPAERGPSACTARGTSRTSAAARTCPAPGF